MPDAAKDGRTVALILPGFAPEGPVRAGTWLGLYPGAASPWSLQRVRIGKVNTFDVCREDSIPVPAFDPPGATLAFLAPDGVLPGPVPFIAKGYFYLSPGDSMVFTAATGKVMLRATGRSEETGTGTAYHDYVLTLSSGGRTAEVWRGEFGDEVPRVQWIGDLDGDGFPDLIFSAPTSGYSTVTQLLLSRSGAGEGAYHIAGEVPITDC